MLPAIGILAYLLQRIRSYNYIQMLIVGMTVLCSEEAVVSFDGIQQSGSE
jgi:hypothetical protein